MFKKGRDSVTFGKQTFRYYLTETKKFKKSFLIALIAIPIAAITLDTIVPYLISQAIGSLSESNYQNFYDFIIPAGIVAMIGVLMNFTGYMSFILHDSNIRGVLAHDALDTVLKKDQSFFANQKIGSLTSKFIDFVNGYFAIQELFVSRIITFIINICLGVFIIWIQTPMLAVIVLVLIAALLFQVRISRRLRSKLRKARKELVAEANGIAADIITNNSTVKTFATEEYELSQLDIVNDRYKSAYQKDYKWMTIEGSSRILLMQLIQIISIVIVANLLITKQIGLSMAIFVILYLQRLSTELFNLGEILFGYDKIMLQAAPMTEILMEQARVIDKDNQKIKINRGKINFENVSYEYPDNPENPVLINFNLEIPAGQKVGLVGYSGAGKTTLTKLLLRFDDLNDGEIKIDNQDISKFTQKSLRQSISYVPQEPMLFHRSLRENIAYGKTDATDSQIIKAAKLANAYDFIKKLPNGLDTIVGERGVKLSGGQRQRIVIARSILKNAPILILDEATSALDSESEALIQKSLGILMRGRTSIVVAHRLSTISKLDRIVVIDKGVIIEDGSHGELLLKNGLYAKLWRHQSGGFIEESI